MLRFLRARPLSCGLALLTACASPSSDDPTQTPGVVGPGQTSPTPEPMGPFDPNPCAHLRGSDRGFHTAASDLGRAHGWLRAFGPEADPTASDRALARALDQAKADAPEAVDAYASQAVGACAAAADLSVLARADVVLAGDIAVVVPGAGELPPIPASATAIAVDVAALPDSDEGRAAADRAFAHVIGRDAAPLAAEERSCNGQPDEVFSLDGAGNIYACHAALTAPAMVHGSSRSLPIWVLTAETLSPAAARLAVTLRVVADAGIVGDSIPVAIAESTWFGVGGRGLAIRDRRLFGKDGTPLPDVIEADVRTHEPRLALVSTALPATHAPVDGPADRPRIAQPKPPTAWTPPSHRVGDARASLVVAYGAVRTFFPYFDVVGDGIDERLDEALAIVEAAARPDTMVVTRALARFSEVLHDGHSWVTDPNPPKGPRSAISTTLAEGKLAVARSATPDVAPGEVLVSINGKPAADVLASTMKYVSGSPQSATANAASQIVPATGTAVFAKSGVEHVVQLAPALGQVTPFGMYDRAPGTLAELGRPDVYYVSVDSYGAHALDDAGLAAAKAGMAGKKLVIDIRGYPGEQGWDLLAYVAPPTSTGPKMAELLVSPAARAVVPDETQTLGAFSQTTQGFTGPVVLLTGPFTQSSAEHWTFFFKSTKRGKQIGETTSGANGNITGVQVPWGLGFSFTGMVIQHPDGSTFHSHGIVPDVVVAPSIADLRDGKDRVLLRALEEL